MKSNVIQRALQSQEGRTPAEPRRGICCAAAVAALWPRRIFESMPANLRALVRQVALVLALLALTLASTGCRLFPPTWAKVAHSPLKPALPQREGIVILRENADSYQNKRQIVGHRILHGGEFFMVLMPFNSQLVLEVENARNLNVLMRAYLAQSVTNAGYGVVPLKSSTKSIPKKYRRNRVLEFGINQFDAGFGSSQCAPDTIEIQLDLRLFEPGNATALWTRSYTVNLAQKGLGADGIIQAGLDQLLYQISTDMVSENFYGLVKTKQPTK